jgi:hypothetical protein
MFCTKVSNYNLAAGLEVSVCVMLYPLGSLLTLFYFACAAGFTNVFCAMCSGSCNGDGYHYIGLNAHSKV